MKKFNILILLCASLISALSLISCGSNDNSLLPVKKGGYWGYVTPRGKYVVNPVYDAAAYLFEGRARVMKDGKIGYIDSKGNVVIPLEYDQGTSFSDGKAFVVKEGGVPVCIDKSGKKLFSVPEGIDEVSYFENKVARCINFGKAAFLNVNGDVCETEPRPEKKLIPREGDNQKIGFVDENGNVKIGYQFDEAYGFQEGLALVKVGNSYGFIDTEGKFVINPQFKAAYCFQQGLAAVGVGKKWGFIDKTGAIVINPEYESVSDFVGDVAFVEDDSRLFGMINRSGKMVVSPQFDDFVLFSKMSGYSVISMKYIGEKFIPDFLSRHTTTGWDGMNSATTLGEVRRKYKNAKADGDDAFTTETTFSPVDGISLVNMKFVFQGKTYQLVDNVVNGFFFSYVSGKKRQYVDSRKLAVLHYDFKMKGHAVYKTYSVAQELAEALSEELDATVEKSDGKSIFELKRNGVAVASIVWFSPLGRLSVIVTME